MTDMCHKADMIADTPANWPHGDGGMARLIRERDWASTPLGAPDDWPRSLRTAVDMMLAMPGPANILWGPAHVQIYNDAYVAIAKDRHPELLGLPAAKGWPEIHAEVLAPVMDAAFAGRATRIADLSVTLRGPDGRPKERAFDTTWSPIRVESGAVGGALEILVEATDRRRAQAVLRETDERQAFLQEFSDALRAEPGVDAIAERAIRMLSERIGLDRCYVAIYRLADDRADFTHQVGNDRVPPLPDGTRLSDFPEALRIAFDRTLVIDDHRQAEGLSDADRRNMDDLGLRALVAATVRKGGNHPLWAIVAVSARPRRWTQGQVALVEEVAERTWVAMERARTKATMRESEERFRTLAESIEDVFYMTDLDRGALDYLSPSYERIWGRPIAELEADLSAYVRTIHPDDLAAFERGKAAQARGEPVATEYRIVRPDGEARWIYDRSFPVGGHGVRRAAGIAADVTARKRIEEAARESGERLRQFGEASSAVIWIRNAETLQWEYLSPAFETIYGLSCDEALSGDNMANWVELIEPEDRDHAMAEIERVRRGERVTFEYRIRRPSDGQVRWLRDTDFPIPDEGGRVERFGGVGEDVTGLKAAEAARAESERRLRTLMEGIPQLVWRSCDEGLWTWASPQWSAYTGQTQEQSRGCGWLDVIHPDDREAAMRAWEAAKPHGLLDVEYRVRRAADGAHVWHNSRSVPVRDAAGRIVEWLGTSTDVQQLKELQERQGVLVAELQHRVRNILTVIRSVFGRTAEGGHDVEEVADHFRGRLDALARTQVIVTTSAAGMVDLENLVRDELLSVGVSDGPDIWIEGPEVRLPPKQAESIGLAVHELTTNAVKYGALKIPGAKLYIFWETNPVYRSGQRLDFTWTEQGVPAVPVAPTREGFGRELIEEALPYRLGAETELEFRPGGVRCRISMPLTDRDAAAMRVDEVE